MLAAKPRRTHDTGRPPLQAPVARLLGNGQRRLGRWAAGDEALGIGQKQPLIALQGQHIVAAAPRDLLGHAGRAMQRIGRNHGAAQVDQVLHFVGQAPWSDAALLARVRDWVLPRIEERWTGPGESSTTPAFPRRASTRWA